MTTTPPSPLPPLPPDPSGGPTPTEPAEAAGFAAAQDASAPFWSWVRGLGVTRSQDRWVAGVAGGIAQRLGVDPMLIRGLFVVAALLGGVGFVAYAIAWALLPGPRGRIRAEEMLHGRFDSKDIGIAIFFLLGVNPLGVGDRSWVWGVGRGLGWTALAVLAIWLWVGDRSGRADGDGSGGDNGAEGASPASAADPGETAAQWGTPAAGDAAYAPIYDAGFEPMPPQPGPMATEESAKAAEKAAAKAAERAEREAARRERDALRPSRAYIAAVLGVAGLAAAGLLAADWAGYYEVSWLTLGAVVLGVLGIGLVLAGLAGRRGGALTVLTVIGLIALPVAAGREAGLSWGNSDARIATSAHFAPNTPAEAEDGLRLVAGSAVVDLTALALSEGAAPVVIPIDVAAGSVELFVPADVTVALDATAVAGSVAWDAGGVTAHFAGGLRSQDEIWFGPDGPAQIEVQLTVLAGSADVMEGAPR